MHLNALGLRLLQQRARAAVVVATLLLACLAAVSPTTSTAAATPALTETSRTVLSPRLLELTMSTTALSAPTKVRVLLPQGYATSSKRYPVLYLLNGGAGSYLDWTTQGNAEAITASSEVIVVMPDGGTGGNYTNWYGDDGSGLKPQWETYHVGQLLPWVDAHFRTLATRSQRAVAGLSMGGNGTMHYAARHPDLFVAAASFSGANDVFNPVLRPITETTGVADGALPGAVFGPSATEAIRWHASNPVDLVFNLKATWIALAFGDGQPGGPLDEGVLPVDVTERAVGESNVKLHDRLVANHIPHVYNAYGPGTHTWGYWKRDLVQTLPQLMAVFAQHRAAPTSIYYGAIEPSYTVFGWSVKLTRPVVEVSRLAGASNRGFVLTGTGTGVVTTPPLYATGRTVRVVVTDVAGRHVRTVVVGTSHRITTSVDLGAPNAFQQDTQQAQVVGTTVREARVTFT
jgi:S-formylglutathione hydrolase FrmB